MASADLDQTDVDAVLEVLHSQRLTMGPKNEEFERAAAAYTGARYAVAVNSGTAGLHLLAIASGIRPGDEVITTSFSFVASTNCFLYLGATPVFIDIDPETYCIDPHLVERAITAKTKAIVAVDIFGHPADWDHLSLIAEKHRIALITDACESLGSSYHGRKTGAFGIGGVFAYFPNKQITTGEGGMIVTDHEDIWRECRSLRNQGRDEVGPWLSHARLGYNYRLTELSAALGISQMRKLDSFVAKRQKVAAYYNEFLAQNRRVRTPRVRGDITMSYFVYVVELQGPCDRNEVMKRMDQRGVPTRGYFAPIHEQPYIRALGLKNASLPVTERVAKKTIALPFHNELSRDEAQWVSAQLTEVLDELV